MSALLLWDDACGSAPKVLPGIRQQADVESAVDAYARLAPVFAAASGVVSPAASPPRRRRTSLDPLQSNVTEDQLAHENSFRHSSWTHDRNRTREALTTVGIPLKRVERFNSCGDNAWIMQHATMKSQFRLKCDKCNDRFCRMCMNEHGAVVHSELWKFCQDKKDLSLATFTLLAHKQDLATCLKRIVKHFRALRKLPMWKCVLGGISITELKWSEEKRRWHVHLHCIIEAPFVQQGFLSQAWHAVTGDSYIVDIRRMGNRSSGLRYITKYVSKGFGSDVIRNEDRLQEAILALRGKRMLTTFGSWRGTAFTEPTAVAPDTGYCEKDWKPLVPLCELFRAADNGLPGANDALLWLRNRRTNLQKEDDDG